jgi:DNA-binding NtrC family response regulator
MEPAANTAPVGGKVLIVDDEKEIGLALAHLMQRVGLTTLQAEDGESSLQSIRTERPDVLIADYRMPGMDGMELMRRAKRLDEDLPVIMITGFAEVRGAVDAIRAGAHDYLAKPFNHHDVIHAVMRALGERACRLRLRTASAPAGFGEKLRKILGPSEAVGKLVDDVERVARSNFSVVILGETGSGKEVIARAIHQQSLRAAGVFAPVDCGAIPEPLLESELFGHERGAFTGASQQTQGRFEAAHGGTLFLDEISNMPLASQAKLLRVIQDKALYRVGGWRPVPVDVRLLAASNHDLQARAEAGLFRPDLYFRLNEFTMRIPPLRQRKDDIPYLAMHFLDMTNAELSKLVKGFSASALEALIAYEWPGNVRQLRSVIRRAVLLASDRVTEEHLELDPRLHEESVGPPETGEDLPLRAIVRRSTIRVERDAIARVLLQVGGNKAKAARLLQVDYKTMHGKVKEYGL